MLNLLQILSYFVATFYWFELLELSEMFFNSFLRQFRVFQQLIYLFAPFQNFLLLFLLNLLFLSEFLNSSLSF
jgi:hypothetical protein